MAELIQLISGDWVDPATVTGIYFHTKHFTPTGEAFLPDRVVVRQGEEDYKVIEFPDAESAKQYRDELAREVNLTR